MLHRTGLESLPCALMLLPVWRFSFVLVWPLRNEYLCASSSISSGQNISFSFLFVFCLHKTSEKGTLVCSEEPSVFPRDGWYISNRYKTPLQEMQNMQKWLIYTHSFQYTFHFPSFFAGGCYAKSLFCLRQSEHLSATYFCGMCTERQNLTLQAFTILSNVIPLIRHNIIYLSAFQMSLDLWSWKVININKVLCYPSKLQKHLFSPWKCLQNKQCCEIIVGNACVILAPDKCTIEINQLSQH